MILTPLIRLEGLSSELERDLLQLRPRNLRIVSSAVKSSSRWLPVWESTTRRTTSFTDYPLLDRLKIPSYVRSYDGKWDPDNYLHLFKGAIQHHISSFVHELSTKSLVEFLSKDLPTTYKGLMEKTYTWIEAKEVSINRAPNDHKEGFDKFNKGFSWHNNKGRKKNWIDHEYETNQCRELRHQIEEAVKSGQLAHLVKCIKKGKAKASDTQLGEWKKGDKDIILAEALILMVNRESHTTKRKSTKESINRIGGSSCEVIYEHCFLKLKPSIKSFRVDSKIPLVRFLTLGWHLEEIHMSWAHLKKKQTRLQTYTKSLERLYIQSVETASQAQSDAVVIYLVIASRHNRLKSDLDDSIS
ncbi:hypothetical protein Tco_0014411 [Tanacetum coccineum]